MLHRNCNRSSEYGEREELYLHNLNDIIALWCTCKYVSRVMSSGARFCQLTTTDVDYAPARVESSSLLGNGLEGIVYSRKSVDVRSVLGPRTALLGLAVGVLDVEVGPLDEIKVCIGSDPNLVRSCSRHTCYSSTVSISLTWHVVVDLLSSVSPPLCNLIGMKRRKDLVIWNDVAEDPPPDVIVTSPVPQELGEFVSESFNPRGVTYGWNYLVVQVESLINDKNPRPLSLRLREPVIIGGCLPLLL